MADDDKSKETEENKSTDTEDKKKSDTDDKATDGEEKWKALARKHERDLKAALKKIQDAEDADKTEAQKAADRATQAESDAKAARAEAARLKVALRKGLTETQAKRLVGETEEEMESDADELLESFKPADDKGKPPGGKPKESLRGGGDPTDEPVETDPDKLAAMVKADF